MLSATFSKVLITLLTYFLFRLWDRPVRRRKKISCKKPSEKILFHCSYNSILCLNYLIYLFPMAFHANMSILVETLVQKPYVHVKISQPSLLLLVFKLVIGSLKQPIIHWWFWYLQGKVCPPHCILIKITKP